MKKIDLVCLPFAGGNKYCYRKLEKVLPPFLNIITLEYPGRGARIREPLMTNINLLVDDLYEQMWKHTKGRYAIYGHSMGGLLACLLTRKIIQTGLPPALHLFITGTIGPSARLGERKWHLLGKSEFLGEIKKMQGSPDEVLANEDVLDHFEPILRADFMASESYVYSGHYPLDLPFTVITGLEEDMEPQDILAWQQESTRTVDFKHLPGKHFFIFDHPDRIVQVIARKLSLYF